MGAIAKIPARSGEFSDPALWGAAVEVCSEGLALVEDGILVDVNPAFTEIFGYLHSAELRNRRLSDLLPEPSPSGDGNGGDKNATPTISFPGGEREGKRKNGSDLHVATASSSFSVSGREYSILSVRVIAQDLLREPQWREAQRMDAIGRLVSGVCHDFNNLLTGVILGCELILNGLEKTHRVRRHVEDIRTAASQGTTLIQQLLALARQRTVEPQLVSWNETIAGMRSLLARLIGENIELITDLAADVSLVRTDPALIHQIVLNLVVNARDAMPDGGQIVLRTRNVQEQDKNSGQVRPCIEFAVSDTGCGMDEETRALI